MLQSVIYEFTSSYLVSLFDFRQLSTELYTIRLLLSPVFLTIHFHRKLCFHFNEAKDSMVLSLHNFFWTLGQKRTNTNKNKNFYTTDFSAIPLLSLNNSTKYHSKRRKKEYNHAFKYRFNYICTTATEEDCETFNYYY